MSETTTETLVGLDGPAMTITVTRGEVVVLHDMFDAILSLDDGLREAVERVLRELDIRLGAAEALRPTPIDTFDDVEPFAPLAPAEMAVLRRAFQRLPGSRRVRTTLIGGLMRELDRRLGYQQAEAARHACATIPDSDELRADASHLLAGLTRWPVV